jgi:hypothetical protein
VRPTKPIDELSDWGFFYPGLIAAATRRMGYASWGGIEPTDVVHDVVCDVLDEKRKCPDGLETRTFLNGCLRSEISHVNGKLGRRLDPVGENPLQDGVGFESAEDPPNGYSWTRSESAEDAYFRVRAWGEAKSGSADTLRKLRDAVKGDAMATRILDALTDGCHNKPKALAAWLDADIKQVERARRRLLRKAALLCGPRGT